MKQYLDLFSFSRKGLENYLSIAATVELEQVAVMHEAVEDRGASCCRQGEHLSPGRCNWKSRRRRDAACSAGGSLNSSFRRGAASRLRLLHFRAAEGRTPTGDTLRASNAAGLCRGTDRNLQLDTWPAFGIWRGAAAKPGASAKRARFKAGPSVC